MTITPDRDRPAPWPDPRAFGAGAPDVSIVVPVYNERENLARLRDEIVAAMESAASSFELIFVDDGSTDGSAQVLRALKAGDARLRILTFDRHAGQTAAMAAGFEAARGGMVVTLDADLQNDPRDIPVLLDALDGCDAVAGWRARRMDSWLRRASSRLANAARRRIAGDGIIDTGCSLKAFRREALSRIKLFRGMHRFLPTLLLMEGFRVRQVKVGHRPRHKGRSKYNVRNRMLRSFTDLLAVLWMKSRTLRYRVTEEE